jgi:DNA-binding NtrC family response regulator
VQSYAALGLLPGVTRAEVEAIDSAFARLVDVRRPYADQKDDVTDRFTRLYLAELLAHTRGNQSEAARLAGLNRSYLGRLLVKHGLARGGAGGGEE